MLPLDEYPIGEDRPAAPTPRHSTGRLWSLAAAGILIISAGTAFYLTRPSTRTADPAVDGAGAAAAEGRPLAKRPLGPEVEPRELPPLDLADPIVREMMRGLSARPELAAWLATDGLVRNLAASIDNVARGVTPSAHLRRLAPPGSFAAEPRGTALAIDPRSYQRYNGIADTVGELDAAALARAYATLRPRLQEAYRDLGYPDGNIDDAVEAAIARLLSTPVGDEETRVYAAPVLYKFSDERLEALTSAQKQLLRMGPRNQRLIQDKLREVGAALGIPG